MTVDSSCLVADDPEELSVRRQYGAWASAAQGVIRDLAAEPGGRPQWPGATPSELRAAPFPMPESLDRAAIAKAREEGWLVTGEGPRSKGIGALAGVTVAVKDVIDVVGLPTGNGSSGLAPRHPDKSAPSWARLEAAGAWCVGKAATHEWAWGVTTPAIGNPSDRSRIAGGSSGGSAAAVAVRAASVGLGTDTGGSIRIPAALCGVVGMKPTLSSVDMTGVSPLAPEQDVVGPLGRSVEAVAALLEVLLDRKCLLADPSVRTLRVGFLVRTGRLQGSVARDYQLTLDALSRSGVELVPLDTILPRLASSVSLATMLASSARLYADDVRARPHAYGSSTRALMTLGEDLVDTEQLSRARQALLASTAALFVDRGIDAVITPTTPCAAPLRNLSSVGIDGRAEPVDAALTRFTAWASATGLPALAVPVGAGRLRTSVQFMAPPHREDLCMQLARFAELQRPEQK